MADLPLIRLDPPKPGDRKRRKGFPPPPRRFDPADQTKRPAGRRLQRLTQYLQQGGNPVELRADPAGLAPERLIVFELTGDVRDFVRAAQNVAGLEFILADDLDADAEDTDPALYLVVPDALALTQIASLWRRFRSGQPLPVGLTPWRDLFAQLRDVRPWGPADRVIDDDLIVLERDAASANESVRVEIELVFRPEAASVGIKARTRVLEAGGEILSECRIEGARYHALLARLPLAELGRIVARDQAGLAGSEEVLHIRPQSLIHVTPFEDAQPAAVASPPPVDAPIAAILDAVPLSQHPLLAGRLSIDDPFDLEPLSVGRRLHGTAMASAVLHGDLGGGALTSLQRRIHFVNVMYATGGVHDEERFPDKLPADIFHEALVRMKDGADPAAPTVIVVNASLGDCNKPFHGRVSGWARVVDHLSYTYGVLFVVSAGNHSAQLETPDMGVIEFEACTEAERAETALRAAAAQLHSRRILSPAESINALTVGAYHGDHFPPVPALSAFVFDVWKDTGMSTVASGLGPGFGNAVKPDVLAPGGRHHVNLVAAGHGHALRPQSSNAGSVAGVKVAGPPSATSPGPNNTVRSVGTSVAAALTTGIAARAHEELERAYPQFAGLPGPQRAALLKALIVHCARWTKASDFILSVLGPANTKRHVERRDNVRRFLGYGLADGQTVLDCATDRATLWAVGRLGREESHTYSVPLPTVMSGKPRFHELAATVAWFAPPRTSTTSYRGVRIKLIEPKDDMAAFAVSGHGAQPDANQTHRGTVVHRRWSGSKAAALGPTDDFKLTIQREIDGIDGNIPYGFAVSIMMPGITGVYTQVRDRVANKPLIATPVPI